MPVGYLVKKTSSDLDNTPWGVQYLLREGYPEERLLELATQAGIKWARFSMPWPSVEPQVGRYDWSPYEKSVAALRSQGVNLFLATSARSHHAYLDFPEGYYYPPTPTERALEGFTGYAAAMVERFGEDAGYIEVWNEPNHPRYWRPEPDPQAYAKLVRRTAAAVRAVKPEMKIIGGVLAGINPDVVQYARDFLSEPGTAEAMDVLTYHPYNPTPEETVEDIRALKEVVHNADSEMPIWQGECGCPSSGDTIHFRGDAPWGYNVQSKWLLRRLLTDYMVGAEVCIYFLLSEFHGNVVNGDPTSRMGYNTKGLVQHTTWQPKPAYYTLQNLTACIDSAWQPVQERAEIEILDPGIFYGIGSHEDRFPCVPVQFAMRKNDTPMLLYWLPWRPQEIVDPASVRVTWAEAHWREPVVVDLITGEVSEATMRGDAVEVPMADYPMIVTERAALDLADMPQQPSYDEIVSKLRWTY